MSNLSKSLSDTPIIKAYPSDQPADAEYQPMHPNLQNAFDASGPKAPVKKGPLIGIKNRRKPVAGPGSWKENKAVEKSLAELRMGRRDPAELCYALIAGNEKEAHYLLPRLSADYVNPGTGKNALHTAASVGCSLQLFDRILSFTMDVNAVDSSGYTALMIATYKNRPHFVRSLVQDNRVDPNIVNNRRNTALHMAVRGGYLKIVRELLNLDNIDTEIVGYGNLTPWELASTLQLTFIAIEFEKHVERVHN